MGKVQVGASICAAFGFDVGGMFTDLMALVGEGILAAKASSTPG